MNPKVGSQLEVTCMASDILFLVSVGEVIPTRLPFLLLVYTANSTTKITIFGGCNVCVSNVRVSMRACAYVRAG